MKGGVFKCDDADADILYVELDKDRKHYTPTTLYDDRFLSPTRFQWESQSKTRAKSETGQRYQTHASRNWRILLFVRQRADDERGFTSPYLFLSPVERLSGSMGSARGRSMRGDVAMRAPALMRCQ